MRKAFPAHFIEMVAIEAKPTKPKSRWFRNIPLPPDSDELGFVILRQRFITIFGWENYLEIRHLNHEDDDDDACEYWLNKLIYRTMTHRAELLLGPTTFSDFMRSRESRTIEDTYIGLRKRVRLMLEDDDSPWPLTDHLTLLVADEVEADLALLNYPGAVVEVVPPKI